jgi:hypothetical protein
MTVSRIYSLAVTVGARISTMSNAANISLPAAMKTSLNPSIWPQHPNPPDHRDRKALCADTSVKSAKKAYSLIDAKALTAGLKILLPLLI